MDFSHYGDEPVQLAVELINTYATISGEDTLETPQDLVTLIGPRAEEWDGGDLVPDETDLRQVKKLRSMLRSVFEAEDESGAADALNGILLHVGAVPRVSVHGAGPHLHFEAAAQGMSRWLGAITAMGLSTALIEGGFERFGRCESTTCDDVYVDTSRNRSRRNCSEKCTTRENVAAYRARQSN